MSQSVSAASARMRTLDLAYTALFSVLIAVCAWVSIPMPRPLVPFTMQTFAVFMSVMCLGGRRGLYSVTVYLLLGAAGVPVFTGFRGGLGVLLDTTGGYLLGICGAGARLLVPDCPFRRRPARTNCRLCRRTCCVLYVRDGVVFVPLRVGNPCLGRAVLVRVPVPDSRRGETVLSGASEPPRVRDDEIVP